MNHRLLTVSALCALPTLIAAQETRQLDAHEHGVSTARISVEDQMLVFDLQAPGMDIVGFEYAAESAGDRDAVADAIRRMARPEMIVGLPDAAGCRLSEVLSHLHSGGDGHDAMDEHAEGEDHGHAGPHAEGEHDDQADGADARHSAFHVRYAFTCDTPDALTEIGFPFFDAHANAEAIQADYVTAAGAGSARIGRDAASLSFD